MTSHEVDGFAPLDFLFVCGIIGLVVSIALQRFLLAKQQAAGVALQSER